MVLPIILTLPTLMSNENARLRTLPSQTFRD
jgi:hypothetical protein